jgi:DNA-binding IclR family transcriptional regulator
MSKIVGRTLDFLELFAEQRRPLSLSDISRLLNIPVSSCHDVLQALSERGYVYELSPRGGYYPTLRLLTMAQAIAEHDPVQQRAEPLLRALRDRFDDTVLLSQISGLSATYLLAFEPSHPLRIRKPVGSRVSSLHATSGGRALLGSLDDDALARTLASMPLPALTPHTATSQAAVRQQIELGRARGWYLNQEESIEGVTTISACFTWHASSYIVTIAGPSPRLVPRLEEAAAALLQVCGQLAMRVSDKIGR